ncbi:MAG: LysR family transcriptional regulator [Lachnospiraceae bacterium]|nr:LysR family transcriptional regulator [Lachnospiraceae bacterium]
MDINYELYKVFYQVASTLSFSQASRQLYISQSAVSQSIKSLEQKLGHPLFIRSTKKVSLTPEGETLFRTITPAIHMIQSAESQIKGGSDMDGQLCIAASDTICRYFLLPYLNRFHTEYPGIHIKIMSQASRECLDLLEKGEVDLTVVNSPAEQNRKSIDTKAIHTFQDVFVANKNYFPIQGHTISLQQLHDLPLIMLEQKTTSSQFLLQKFEKMGYALVPDIELTSNDLVIDMATIGLGIGLVPDYMLEKKQTELSVCHLEIPLPGRSLLLAFRKQTASSDILQAFSNYFI